MSARIENIAAELFSAKGADVKVAAFMASVGELAAHAYKHGSNAEQWQGKGSAARPMRGPWAIAFGFAATDNGAMVKGKEPQTAMAKAFRAVAALVAGALAEKGRDRTEDGCDSFELEIHATAQGILAPARAPRETDKDAAEAKALARALETIKSGAARLTETDAAALRAALATYDALRAAAAPAAPAAPAKPTAPATAPTAPATAPTAMAQAMAAALA